MFRVNDLTNWDLTNWHLTIRFTFGPIQCLVARQEARR